MFTLAHLSDPHLGPIPTPRPRELLNKRGLGLINWYRKRHRHHRADVLDAIVADMKAHAPDHIAVTGDLVNISLDTEFARAATWLDTVGKPDGRDARRPAITTPTSGASPGTPRSTGASSCAATTARLFPSCAGAGRVAIVALTTSLPTGPFMATGRLGGEQLARLAEILLALSREPVFRVVLIHHPPVPCAPPPHEAADRRADAARAARRARLRADAARAQSRTAVDCGSTDRRAAFRRSACRRPRRSSATHDEPAAYNLYRIGGAPGAWECEMTVRGYAFGREGITELKKQRLIG